MCKDKKKKDLKERVLNAWVWRQWLHRNMEATRLLSVKNTAWGCFVFASRANIVHKTNRSEVLQCGNSKWSKHPPSAIMAMSGAQVLFDSQQLPRRQERHRDHVYTTVTTGSNSLAGIDWRTVKELRQLKHFLWWGDNSGHEQRDYRTYEYGAESLKG